MSLAQAARSEACDFMRLTPSFNLERWEWFAAGDPEVAPRFAHGSGIDSSAEQLLFETGLVILVPLLLATFIGLVFLN
jgi:hypothetical protein